MYDRDHVRQVFEQKQRYDRADLKIFSSGLLLNGPDESILEQKFHNFYGSVESLSRLADVIPWWYTVDYSEIGPLVSRLAINVLDRFADLASLAISEPVRDHERFLDLLKNFQNIVELWFECAQPQELAVRPTA